MVSQIWGLQVRITVSTTEYLEGYFRAAPFNDIWQRLQNAPQDAGDTIYSAFYQSVLDYVTWSDQISSPLLKSLQQASPAALSIKFTVDSFQANSAQPDFTQGRIVGTIGPAWADEPPNFVIGRLLRPSQSGPPVYYAPARVDKVRSRLLVDLSNSIPTDANANGAPVNLGDLKAAIAIPSQPAILLSDINYSEQAYNTFAGVQEFPLDSQQLAQIASNPIAVVQMNPTDPNAAPQTLLQENANGAYVFATEVVHRMDPGDTDAIDLIATLFGERAANQTIALQLASGKPVRALSFPKSVKTNDDGRASFALTAGNPNNPRKFIDGQVYQVGFSWDKENDQQFPPDPNNALSAHVYNTYDKAPVWENVAPVLQQYAKLYPFMNNLLHISGPSTIQANIAAFKMVLNIPMTDPRYMPVTRDMSRDKRQLIIDWLDLGAPGPTS
jgi:hypothetical protein